MRNRQEMNREILDILNQLVEAYPKLRFGQLVDGLDVFKPGDDIFYKESKDILKDMKQSVLYTGDHE